MPHAYTEDQFVEQTAIALSRVEGFSILSSTWQDRGFQDDCRTPPSGLQISHRAW